MERETEVRVTVLMFLFSCFSFWDEVILSIAFILNVILNCLMCWAETCLFFFRFTVTTKEKATDLINCLLKCGASVTNLVVHIAQPWLRISPPALSWEIQGYSIHPHWVPHAVGILLCTYLPFWPYACWTQAIILLPNPGKGKCHSSGDSGHCAQLVLSRHNICLGYPADEEHQKFFNSFMFNIK